MDVTPLIPVGRQIIERYGGNRFRVSGTVYESSVIVFPDHTLAWPVAAFADVTFDACAAIADAGRQGALSLLLLGCGPRLLPVPQPLRLFLRAAGVVVEPMDTGAACRTYNVLMAEGRKVAAALIPVE